MTNEEILQNHAPGWLLKLPSEATQDFKEAMDEARKDEAVKFGQFLLGFTSIESERGIYKWWDKNTGGKTYTTEQLYELFKQKEK